MDEGASLRDHYQPSPSRVGCLSLGKNNKIRYYHESHGTIDSRGGAQECRYTGILGHV